MSYLKRAREHKEFLLNETKEFERGKRHLANIMGIDSSSMTQKDIDDAISYLFPSALFEKQARPMMKHPDLLYKAQKEAQFDTEGRPHHFLFYTTRPNYYERLHTVQKYIRDLNEYEDEQLARGVLDPPPEAKYEFGGRQWIGHEQFATELIEGIDNAQHQYFIKCLEHLARHPYSNRVKDFLDQHSRELAGKTTTLMLPELKKDESTGAIYTELTGRHREHEMSVRTVLNGTGKIDIEGHDILYFKDAYLRRAIYFPISLTGMQDKIDIYARYARLPVTKGDRAIAQIIRETVSFSIAAFVDDDMRERMRLAGLLTIDKRLAERKKFGQMKARRKYTWKKR